MRTLSQPGLVAHYVCKPITNRCIINVIGLKLTCHFSSCLCNIKYLPLLTFSCRFLWTVIVLTSVGLFCYLFIQRLNYHFTFPKAVNVEVIYNKTLPFPAVTVCNQNLFRLVCIPG